MSILQDYPELLQVPESIREVRYPELPPIREDERDQAVWLDGLVAYHECQAGESATDPIGVHELLADRLGVLRRTLCGQSSSGIAAHDEQEGELPAWWFTELDRRMVGRGPLRQFESLLARCILDEAALLAPYGTPAKRLAVHRMLRLASDVEGFRAEDAWTFAAEYERAKGEAIADLLSGGW